MGHELHVVQPVCRRRPKPHTEQRKRSAFGRRSVPPLNAVPVRQTVGAIRYSDYAARR